VAPSENPINTNAIWVESDQQLASLCQQWRQQAAVAIDTEFMRTSTFYPLAALFQLSDGKECYLIDPLAIEDFEPFCELLTDPAVVKVLHACSEDLEVFRSFLDVVPTPLFDTQVAAAYTGEGFSMGYARLVEAMLGVALPKSETRSDWMQRPLSQSQLRYAALDVAYLMVVYGKQLQALKQLQRLTWVQTECQTMVSAAEQEPPMSDYYLKIKSAWKLTRQELAILRCLSTWREQQARARDIPRNRLIKEHILWDMAKYKPRQLEPLASIEGMPPRTVRADGEQLLALIEQGMAVATPEQPPLMDKPLSPAVGDLLKALKRRVREIADDLNVAPEVLVRKKDYEALIRSGMGGQAYCLPSSLKGWREPVVGQALLSLIQQY
jgi:ribonuclease D